MAPIGAAGNAPAARSEHNGRQDVEEVRDDRKSDNNHDEGEERRERNKRRRRSLRADRRENRGARRLGVQDDQPRRRDPAPIRSPPLTRGCKAGASAWLNASAFTDFVAAGLRPGSMIRATTYATNHPIWAGFCRSRNGGRWSTCGLA